VKSLEELTITEGTIEGSKRGTVVCLKEIVENHPSVVELADLPMGWQAYRETADQPWERSEMD
jgi:hypothetical protein